MKIENMISEYENERSSLIFSLYAASKDPERLKELREEIKELDEILAKLNNEKRENGKRKAGHNKRPDDELER